MHIGFNALTLKGGEYSGVHVAVRGLANALVQGAGAEDRFTVYAQREAAGLPRASERVRLLRPLWPVGWRVGRITYEQFRLPGRVFRDGVDLLHCPAYVMPHWCLKPVVLSVHDLFALRQPELCTAANRSHFSRMMPKSLARARRIIVPSAWVGDEILAYDRAQPEGTRIADLAAKIRVIPWGVDARFQPVTDERRREEVAIRYGLPPKFVLWVGRLEPKKNMEKAVEAYFAAIMSKSLPHRLVLVGPRGWGVVAQMRRTIRHLGLDGKAVLAGFIPDEDLPAIYSMAACLVFPSLAEGFGFPVLEAMACGTPVICSDIPPLRALAGEAAERVPPGDLPGLRLALEKVLCDEDLARTLAARGTERVKEFTWEAHAAKTRSLYEDVILEDRRARG